MHKVLDSFPSIERNEKKNNTQGKFHMAPSMRVVFACAVFGGAAGSGVSSGTDVCPGKVWDPFGDGFSSGLEKSEQAIRLLPAPL